MNAATMPSVRAAPFAPFDVEAIRRDFPVLARTVHGKPLAYLDNAASSQRPRAVIDAVSRYYETTSRQRAPRRAHAEPGGDRPLRGRPREGAALHQCSARRARSCSSRGTTEAINLVAQSYGRPRFGPGDEILISWLEHHANIVPWQTALRADRRAPEVAPITRSGEVDFDAFAALLVAAHPAGGAGARLERARHRRPGRALHRRPPARAASRSCSTARRPCRTCGSTCRRSTATSTASPATRCAARPASACSTAARRCCATMPPWQGGGDMILAVSFEKTDLQRPAVQVRGRHAAHRRARSASAPRSTTSTRSAWSASPRHEHALLEYATARLQRRAGRCGSSAPRATRRPSCRSRSTACTRTTSARSSTTRASRSAPVTTARCR